jgi:hypothetical protein
MRSYGREKVEEEKRPLKNEKNVSMSNGVSEREKKSEN